MKKQLIFLIIFFLIYTAIVCFCPAITQWDRNIIVYIQGQLNSLPAWIPLLTGSQIYAASIVIPLVTGFIFFFKELLLIDMVLFFSAPLIAYILNSIIKNLVQRPRPPYELQLGVHLDNYSYVSNHTFISTTLWGLVIFYLIKYCKNNILKYIGVSISALWIVFIGLSRMWLGVHNPTDILGGYLLAGLLLFLYIRLIKLIGGKC
ncbi:MAG: phosphatase PAP2 family protein [bacterium]|nr:phosphatase PAP2 family protein [bacterium]